MSNIELPKNINVAKYIHGSAIIREIRIEKEDELYIWFFYGNTFLEINYTVPYFEERYETMIYLLNELGIKYKLVEDNSLYKKYKLYKGDCNKLDIYFKLVATFKDFDKIKL